jgi:hypothetical protein
MEKCRESDGRSGEKGRRSATAVLSAEASSRSVHTMEVSGMNKVIIVGGLGDE